MKKLLLILIILLTVGCSTKYELYIKDGSIEESINFSLEKKGIKDDNDVEALLGSDDYIDSLVSTQITAVTDNIYSNKYYYNKDVNQNGNIYNFNLNYEYLGNDFLRSRTINECFEKHEINIDGKKVYIHLSGEFYCLYDGEIDIAIKSDNPVINTNGKKEDSVYHWYIDSSNYNDVDILIETSDKAKDNTRKYILYIIASIAGIAVLGFLLYYGGNLLNKDDVNSI